MTLSFTGLGLVIASIVAIYLIYLGNKSSKWFLQKGRAKLFNKVTGDTINY